MLENVTGSLFKVVMILKLDFKKNVVGRPNLFFLINKQINKKTHTHTHTLLPSIFLNNL